MIAKLKKVLWTNKPNVIIRFNDISLYLERVAKDTSFIKKESIK